LRGRRDHTVTAGVTDDGTFPKLCQGAAFFLTGVLDEAAGGDEISLIFVRDLRKIFDWQVGQAIRARRRRKQRIQYPRKPGSQQGNKLQHHIQIRRLTSRHRQSWGELRKKILKQSFTLTLEELLLIAPKFIQELQKFSKDKVKVMECNQNSGRCNRGNFEDDNFIDRGCHQSPGKTLTYAFLLGFVNLNINGRKLRALVYIGAELNIIPEEVALIKLESPMREISMSITVIEGLAEGISFNIDTKDRKAANFFINMIRCVCSCHSLGEKYQVMSYGMEEECAYLFVIFESGVPSGL
ncbi:hypothetical protein VP01_432g14, partial [Puccinia sorghi]